MSALDFSYSAYQVYGNLEPDEAFNKYMLDTNRIKYGVSLIDGAISRNTDKVVSAIDNVSNQIERIGDAANAICGNLERISDQLEFLNRKMDIVIEQQRMTNMLLRNIDEILKIPESEKERQHTIALAINFLANASSDSSLYDDALEEFIKAESMQKQDYFVLHRIGMIYLFSEKNFDLPKALDYFSRAAKYAKVESDPKAARLADVLIVQNNSQYVSTLSNPDKIKLLTADSYGKAAFSAYVLGDIPKAIEQQNLAYYYNSSDQNLFLLSKYQSHRGDLEESINNLRKAITGTPVLAEAVFHEIDLMERPEIIELVTGMDNDVSSKLLEIQKRNLSQSINEYVGKALKDSYSGKCTAYARLKRRGI